SLDAMVGAAHAHEDPAVIGERGAADESSVIAVGDVCSPEKLASLCIQTEQIAVRGTAIELAVIKRGPSVSWDVLGAYWGVQVRPLQRTRAPVDGECLV